MKLPSKILLARILMQHSGSGLPPDMDKAKKFLEILDGSFMTATQDNNLYLYNNAVCLQCHTVIHTTKNLPVDYVTCCENCAQDNDSGEKFYSSENFLRKNSFGYLLTAMKTYLSISELQEVHAIVTRISEAKQLDKWQGICNSSPTLGGDQ